MKEIIDISNLIVNDNIIKFTLKPNIKFTLIDLFIYNNNQKLSINNFSLESSDENYTLIINKNIPLTDTLYFFINTQTYFSGIIYIYYNINLLEFNTSISILSLNIPRELESYNYSLSIMTFENNSSSIKNLIVCNGISQTSNIRFISSDDKNKEFEITLFDNLNNTVPDGEYNIEIFTGG